MRRLALIVDDEPDIRDLCVLNLRFADWESVEAGSLDDARRILDERTPDWVVLDIHLPDGEGWELLAELRRRARTRGLPVLLLTADAATDEFDQWTPGLLELLVKPFLPSDLVAAAERAGSATVDVAARADAVLRQLD